jgi:sec-independent protein translocase protein TatA
MISGLGFQEMFVILMLALIVFGPKRLPELARQLGRLTREIRKLSWEFRSAIELESLEEESTQSVKTPSMCELGYESQSDQKDLIDNADDIGEDRESEKSIDNGK